MAAYEELIARGALLGPSETRAAIPAGRALVAAAEGVAGVLDGLGDALFAFDASGRLARMNTVAQRLCGLSPEEGVGRLASEVLPLRAEGSNRVIVLPLPLLLREPGRLAPGVELLLARRDGVVRAVSGCSAPVREPNRSPAGILVVLRDVQQERDDIARERRRQHELLELVDGFPDGVAVCRGPVIAYASSALGEMLGLPREQIIGRRLDEFLHAPDVEEVRSRLSFSTSGAPGSIYRVPRAPGEGRLIEVSAERKVDFEGGAGSLFILKDVTEREKLRTEMGEKDRLASVGTLAAGIAHEINNPLTYVLANARFALDQVSRGNLNKLEDVSELKDALTELCEGAQRAAGIVNDLKGFARADKGDTTPADPAKVLEMALRMTQSELKRRARVESNFAFAPQVGGGRVRLGQLFVNLLVNAAQAIAPGNPERNFVTVALDTDERGWARVHVRDSGCGMSPGVRAHIFEPFFTTKPVGQGTGLGLSICHGIVTGMGGEIFVESEEGIGSTFTVCLPPADR